jgi:DNA-binding LacI/PurR family transcriptional regulator
MHRQLPVVLINAAIDRLPFPRVVCDDASAMEQSMEHLLALGHERIGLVLGPRDHVPSERKLAAARQVAEAAGHPLDEELVVRSLYSLQSGQASAARLIERGATGIICASDPLALGAVRAVRRARLATPEDVSVIGYDDSAFMAVADPPLTTVRQPIEAMARAAVDFLMSQIEASMGPVDELLFEPELVVRRSTGPAKLPAADAKS